MIHNSKCNCCEGRCNIFNIVPYLSGFCNKLEREMDKISVLFIVPFLCYNSPKPNREGYL